MASDYASLKAEVISEAWRDGDADFAALVPGYIQRAEARLNRALRVAEMEAVATVTLTNGAGDLPDDFYEARRVIAGSPSVDLQLVTPSFATETYPTNYGGRSRQYTRIGNTLQTYPSGTGDVTLVYYAKIPALSDTNPTNWLLDKAPDLYLYASMVEAAPSMLDDARLQTWMTLYRAGLNDFQNADKAGRWAGVRARVAGPTP